MSVDIVNLIESNPITKLSGNYHSKLVEKVKNNFNNYEQQMFLSSFYCYLQYDSKNDFVIDLDNVWKWVEFSSKHKAKELLNKFFIINNDYKCLLTQSGEQKKDTRGGHNKEIIMLNVDTFKKFCLKAGTKKADEIHNYFIKLENIMFEITQEESKELQQQVLQLENKNKDMQINLLKQRELDKEQFLLKEYNNAGNMIYIIKVKINDDGTYIIKIGESRKGITERYNECKSKHQNILLLDCFLVDKSKEFESFIHNHPSVHTNKCKTLKGHEKENELFLVGKELSYQMLLKIINDNIHNYSYKVRELLLEIENLKLKNNSTNINYDNELLMEVIKTNKLLLNKVNSLEQMNQEILNKLNTQQTKVTTGFGQQLSNFGPRLQKINAENLQLIKFYETVTEAMNEDKRIKRPSIMKAIDNNSVYCGYRWLLVDRNLDPTIIHSIESTKITKVQHLGYIAKINSTKTEIINVYLDRKTAALNNGYNSPSGLDIAVRNNSISNGYYYMLYENCDENLICDYELKYGEPILYKNGVGQFSLDNTLIQEFTSKYNCIQTLRISEKTLTKALQNNSSYNGFTYKILGEKLCHLV